jgi:hypothetical protein
MNNLEEQNKLLALALYEIRLLLGTSIGSDNEADISTRIAAHLSYSLHNQASAILDGKSFNIEEALENIKKIDNIVGKINKDTQPKNINFNL